VGQRTGDGVTTSWVFDLIGATAPWALTVAGTPYTVTPVSGGGNFEWDPATATLYRGTAPIPGVGQVIEVQYWVSCPFTVRRSDAVALAALMGVSRGRRLWRAPTSSTSQPA
jgi:hypothetical protein